MANKLKKRHDIVNDNNNPHLEKIAFSLKIVSQETNAKFTCRGSGFKIEPQINLRNTCCLSNFYNKNKKELINKRHAESFKINHASDKGKISEYESPEDVLTLILDKTV